MNGKRRAEELHAWWKDRPAERYWLDVTHRADRDQFLAAPRGDGTNASRWSHRLITCVRNGDVVFHYDAAQSGIVAASLAHGRVGKRQLFWRMPTGSEDESIRKLRSWRIGLRQSAVLDAVVSLGEIARTQWSLFPALRALEDEVGDPLYYPFEMGNQEDTRPLPGYVLKLPALLVDGIPGLARAAARILDRASLPVSRARATADERRPRATAVSGFPSR